MRARSIKPGFFKNEDLSECTPFARLLFPGLWMLADREGKLEYRPKRIKAEIFPFDAIDVAALVRELETHGLVKTYSADGVAYLWVIKFLEHQKPHQNETASVIPNYINTDEGLATMAQSPSTNGASPSTNGASASTNGASASLLYPSSLIPLSLDIPASSETTVSESAGTSIPDAPDPHTSPRADKAPRPKKDEPPKGCPPETWEVYLKISRGFHRDKAKQLGAMAPLTDAKVIDGAKALDTLIRLRGRPEDEVIAVLGWSIEDQFWSKNLRSIRALLKTSSSNGETKYANVLTAMTRDIERKVERSMAANG